MSEKLILFLAIGFGLTLLGLLNLLRCLGRRKWPETVGKIRSNRIREVTSDLLDPLRTDPIGSFAGRSYAGTDKSLELHLSYVYAVDKYKYIGNQLYSAPIIKARSRIAGLHSGTKVKVFYNPNNPAASFLAHSFAWPSLLIMCSGLIALIVAAYVQLNA